MASVEEDLGTTASEALRPLYVQTPYLAGCHAVFAKVHARFHTRRPARDFQRRGGPARKVLPVSHLLPFQPYCASNMTSCPVCYWEKLYSQFQSPRLQAKPGLHAVKDTTSFDLSQVWSLPLLQLDPRSVARIASVSPELSRLVSSLGTMIGLSSRFGAPGLKGSVSDLCRLGSTLEDLRCIFLPGWDGDATVVKLALLRRARQRFQEARMFLWQAAFPPDAASQLTRPLASVQALPAASIRIGTVTLNLTLHLMCVSEQFFDAARPLRRLLVRLDVEIDNGPVLFPGGAPGPDGHKLCGDGHRWACVCESIEEGARVPVFCSFRESYLRPASRHPRVISRCERVQLQRCEPVDGEAIAASLAAPFRLILSIYRTDDDDGPDEPDH